MRIYSVRTVSKALGDLIKSLFPNGNIHHDHKHPLTIAVITKCHFAAGFFFRSIKTSCCHLLGFLSVRSILRTQQKGRFFPCNSSSEQ